MTTVLVRTAGYRGAGGRIYLSKDAGQSWTGFDKVRSWRAVASSADGTRLVALEDSSEEGRGGFVHTSSDAGATWTVQEGAGCRHWRSVASSSDGEHIAAVVGGYTGIAAFPLLAKSPLSHGDLPEMVLETKSDAPRRGVLCCAGLRQVSSATSTRAPTEVAPGLYVWQTRRTVGVTSPRALTASAFLPALLIPNCA